MKLRKSAISVEMLFLIVFLPVISVSYADDASVLPKGVSRVMLDSNFYFPVDQRYGPDGGAEDVAADYNRSLNSSVFSALAPLDPFVPGLPSIGDSIVSFQYHFTMLNLGFQYGVTDKLSMGITIPYWWIENDVEARLDSGTGSSANVGKNPCFGAAGCPSTSPIIPIASGGVRMDTEDVQALLGRGLDVNGDGTIDIAGFQFDRFESWSYRGLSDIEAGFKYRYLKTDDWRLAVTGGAKFPTGRVDDPDNLTDYGSGANAYILAFRLHNDYILSNLWKAQHRSDGGAATGDSGLGDVVLNGTVRYDVVLPDRPEKRVPGNVNNPVTANKERVRRDMGDNVELEFAAKYAAVVPGLHVSAIYKYAFKMKDRVSGSSGFAYESLEAETARTEQIYTLGLSYTTMPLFVAKKFPVPLTASVAYRDRFAGSNNILKSKYITAGLQVFF